MSKGDINKTKQNVINALCLMLNESDMQGVTIIRQRFLGNWDILSRFLLPADEDVLDEDAVDEIRSAEAVLLSEVFCIYLKEYFLNIADERHVLEIVLRDGIKFYVRCIYINEGSWVLNEVTPTQSITYTYV